MNFVPYYRGIKGESFRELMKTYPNYIPHYGDPPNMGCCPAGPTMNCEDIKILEFWEMVDMRWVRVPELEIESEEGGSREED